MKKIFIAITFSALASTVCGEVCETLKQSHREFRYLPDQGLREYCRNGCVFLKKFNCDQFMSTQQQQPLFGFNYTSFFRSQMQRTDEDRRLTWMRFDVSASLYAQLLKVALPYLAAIIPILLQWVFIGGRNPHESSRAGLIAANTLLCIAFAVYFGYKSMVTINYVTYSYMSAFSVIGSRVFQDLVVMYGVIGVVIIMSLATDDLYVLGLIGITAGIGLIGQIYVIAGRRSYSDRATLVTSLCNLAVVSDLIHRLLYMFALDNFGVAILRLVVRAVIPIGNTESLMENIIDEAAFVAGHAGSTEKVQVGIFFASMIAYLGICLCTRAAIGAIVLASLKFDFSFNCFITGFYAYAVDMINPFSMVAQHMLSSTENSVRKTLYGLVMISLMYHEFFYARDFLFLRFFLFILDLRVLQTGMIGSSRFLDAPIEMSGIAFPKPGAFPFASLDSLVKIRNAAKRLTVSVRSNPPMSYSGVGMLWHGKSGPRLLTVRHVITDKHEVEFEADGRSSICEVKGSDIIGTSIDPTVSMKLLVQHEDSADVPFLSITETKLVSYLFVISPEGVICPVTKWRFDNKGDIHATVNLMQGDSGTPVIAVLADGSCRFAGTVSRGDARTGHSNLFSSVVSDERYTGSPGTIEPYLEVMNIRTQSDLDLLSGIHQALRDERRRFLDEFPDNEENPRDDYHEGSEGYRSGKSARRVKNWKRDKAARKRGFMTILQSSILSSDQRAEAELAFDESRVIEFNARRSRRGTGHGIGFVPASQSMDVNT